jgi:hypothetical protein
MPERPLERQDVRGVQNEPAAERVVARGFLLGIADAEVKTAA